MTQVELRDKLDELLALPDETEWVEFKEAKNSYDFDDLGKYFSALSNEANLKAQRCAWFVFGVQDKPRKVIASRFRSDRKHLDSLKHEIAKNTSNGLTFVEIHELAHPDGRVVMFQIPPALRGMPTAWKGHYYGRDGESLVPLNLLELEQIRAQATGEDWSAGIVEGASIADLDPEAIAKARAEYKNKQPKVADEVDGWDDATFLNKAKVTINGKLTRAAIILLGREESEHFLSPASAKITWVLKDAAGIEKDYQHFGPPLLLNVDRVFAKIRNLTYRYLKNNRLFPTEVTQYDPWVIREALNNCIAHEDYTLHGRISVVEQDDRLLFSNLGAFIPSTVENVIERDSPPEVYRNPFLASAMVNLNLIDTIGSGIRRMFQKQRERYFPMPDYDLSEPQKVKVRVTGKVLDENYTRILMSDTDLDLLDVIALDKVQKHRPLSDAEFESVKAKKLIEGRRPNIFVSAKIAAITDRKAEYIRNRGLDKQHYKALVLEYLTQFGDSAKPDIERLLLEKLSDALTPQQKRNFIRNLLQEMKVRDGSIQPVGAHRWAKWSLTKRGDDAKA